MTRLVLQEQIFSTSLHRLRFTMFSFVSNNALLEHLFYYVSDRNTFLVTDSLDFSTKVVSHTTEKCWYVPLFFDFFL